MVPLPHPVNSAPSLDSGRGRIVADSALGVRGSPLPLAAPATTVSLLPQLAGSANDSRSTPPNLTASSNLPRQADSNGIRSKPMVITIAVAASAVVAVVIIAIVLPFFRRGKLKKKKDRHKRGDLEEPFPRHPPPPPLAHLHQHHPHHRRPPPASKFPVQKSTEGGFEIGNFEKSDPRQKTAPEYPRISWGYSKLRFTFQELKRATNDFSKSNLIGEGGFGFVYKGQLPGGKVVAVKQLKVGGGQGEREFQAEVEIISRVHHRNLVSLVGYCIFENQRLLVYDFVPNNTLDYHLHGAGRPVMDWPTRIKIAIGAARGIAYLHEDCHPRIIHRDIKSSNILLDENFEAQVSDFGLAKLTPDNHTHETTRVMGTIGYLAPEYASTGKITIQSDVYSFGVLLLELITGEKPVRMRPQGFGMESLVDWARPLLVQTLLDGNLDPLVDPNLLKAYDPSIMLRMVEAAAACVRRSARGRPPMSKVVFALANGGAELTTHGIQPAYSAEVGLSDDGVDYNSSEYSADLHKFRQIVLSSQDMRNNYNNSTGPYEDDGAQNASVNSTAVNEEKKRKIYSFSVLQPLDRSEYTDLESDRTEAQTQ